MFDSIRSEKSSPTQTESLAAVRPEIGDPDAKKSVYTLPKEFLPTKRLLPASGGSFFASWKVVALIASIGVIFIAIIGILVYWLTQQNNTTTQTQAFPLTTNQAATTNTVSNSSTQLNLNVNQGLNSNVNAGLFPNDNTNTNTTTNTNSVATGVKAFSVKTTVPLAADKDKDQLTDAEEALYGTKVGLPDSDSDGFIDGTEVLKAYSPIAAKKTLRDSGLVLPYNNTSFGWSMDYPSKWVAGASDDAGKSVLFTSDSVQGEYVQVVMVDNPQGATAKDWYMSVFTDTNPASLQDATVAGLSGIVSADGYTYYLADAKNIIGISYNFGTKDAVSFKTTFQMMLSSFAYNPAAATASTATNTSSTFLQPTVPTTNTNTTNTNTASTTTNTNTTKTNTNTNTTNKNTNTNTTTSRTVPTNTNTTNANTVRTIQ
mgnify:CR=1 FL=1